MPDAGDTGGPGNRPDLGGRSETSSSARGPANGSPRDQARDGDLEDTLELPIEDVLDLHTFRPRDVPNVVRDYLDAAHEAGLRQLRIVHGRGRGVQRRTVRTLLERDPRVIDFGDAPLEAGGWGATWVTFE